MSSSVIDDKSESKVELLDDSQAEAFLDKQTQALLKISGAEFIERASKGEYKDACEDSKILRLLMMIPKSAGRCDHK